MSFIKRFLCKLEEEKQEKMFEKSYRNAFEKAVEIPPDYDEWLAACYENNSKENYKFGR